MLHDNEEITFIVKLVFEGEGLTGKVESELCGYTVKLLVEPLFEGD